jgi:hypothetical protein
MKNKTFALAAIGVSLFLAGCEIGPKATEQTGPRGSGIYPAAALSTRT